MQNVELLTSLPLSGSEMLETEGPWHKGKYRHLVYEKKG